MPLNSKGVKIKKAMIKEYGAKKGASVFFASENKGTIKGIVKHRKNPVRQHYALATGTLHISNPKHPMYRHYKQAAKDLVNKK